MKCAWQELLGILPDWMRRDVDELGKDTLQEIRMRLGQGPVLCCHGKNYGLKGSVSKDDIHFTVNTASRYSPWSAATSAQGYITAPGGHRIGICGEAVIHDDQMTSIRNPSSLCVRVARDFPGIALNAASLSGNILIIGPPGSGKTTYLRDLIRQRGNEGTVAVVDERGELFPAGFYRGSQTDVLTGVGKSAGMDCVIRTMSPHTVAVDEITSERDCAALLKACWCGVDLLATAHASSVAELKKRTIYRPLVDNGIFQYVIVLRRDKQWHLERMAS